MNLKRILVHVNNVISIFTKTLLLLLISIPVFKTNRTRIRIPLAVNVIVLIVLLLIVAAYGGAFSKKSSQHSAQVIKVDSLA
jgi:hypothetical protein